MTPHLPHDFERIVHLEKAHTLLDDLHSSSANVLADTPICFFIDDKELINASKELERAFRQYEALLHNRVQEARKALATGGSA